MDKVLCISGSINCLDWLRELSDSHYQLLIASSAHEGQRMLKEHSFQLIIVEQSLPDMLGTDLLADLKEICADTKLILVFDSVEEIDEKTIDDLGIYWTLSKPIDLHQLKQVLKSAFTKLKNEEEKKIVNERLEKLRQYEKNFTISRDLQCVVNKNGCFNEVSPQFSKLLGYTEKELLGNECVKFVHPDDVEKTLDKINDLIQGKEVREFTSRFLASGGNYVWVSWFCIYEAETELVYGSGKNITPKVKLQEKLKARNKIIEEQSKQISETQKLTNLGSWEWDMVSKKATWSAETYKIFGLDKNTFTPTYNGWLNALHADDFERVTDMFKSLIKNLGKTEFVHRIIWPNGEERMVQNWLRVERDIKGTPVKLIGNILDLTEATEAKNKLKNLKEKYKSLFDYSPEAIHIHNHKCITNVNQAFLDLFGYKTKDDIIGKPALESIVHPDDIEMVKKSREQVKSDGKIMFTKIRHIKQDGTIFTCEAHVSNVVIDGVNHRQIITRELTEKLKLENALIKSEEKFRGIFNSMIDIFIRVNSKGFGEMVSPSAKTLGYNEQDIIGKPIVNLYVNPQNRYEYLNEIKQNGICKQFETQIYAKSGEIRDISISGRLYKDNDGEWGVESLFRDITTHKKQQLQLKNSELTLRKFIEMSPVGIVINDMHGKFIDVNPEFSRFTGYTADELKTLTYWNLTPEKYAETEQEQLLAMEKHNKYGPYEKEFIHKKGHLFPVLLNGVKLRNQDGDEFIWSIVQDVTERRRNERELFETQKKNSDLWNAVNKSSLVSITDNRGMIKFANNKFSEISGFSFNELKGQNHSINSSGYHTKEFWKDLWRTILKGNVWRGEVKNKSKTGEYYWVDTVITPIKNEKGEVIEFLSFRSLITQRKLLAIENSELLESLKEYAFQTSHELRAPLANLLGLSQLVVNQYYAEGELIDIFKMIHESSTAMDSVIIKMNQALEAVSKKDNFLGIMR